VATLRADASSILHLYRDAIRLRPRGTTLEWLAAPDDSLVFRTGDTVVAVNFGDGPAQLDAYGELVLASDPDATATKLPPDAAAWFTHARPEKGKVS
jgi:hypothetical protein